MRKFRQALWYCTVQFKEYAFLQVGAVIVKGDAVLGKGHNRMPEGCEQLPWSDDETMPLESKYPYGNIHIITLVYLYMHKQVNC